MTPTPQPASRPVPWQGGLTIGPSFAVWQGVIGDSTPHRHTAAQVVLARDGRDGRVEVEDGRGQVLVAACVRVDPMAWHRLRPGADLTLVFLEPWADPRTVVGQTGLPAELPARVAAGVRLGDAGRESAFWQRWIEAAERGGGALEEHPEEHRAWFDDACGFIEKHLADGRLGLDALAAHLQLSGHHARHRFAQAAGLPFKRYVLWRRLRLATLALREGRGATAAAHEAGFADAAHFARTLKAMFGVTATQIRA